MGVPARAKPSGAMAVPARAKPTAGVRATLRVCAVTGRTARAEQPEAVPGRDPAEDGKHVVGKHLVGASWGATARGDREPPWR
jgi:hypothetical protein